MAPLIVLAGPTASGKSALALRLAERFAGEIVSCDSVAVYRGMEIGTAKPSRLERRRVKHHMIDVAWPDEAFNAGDYSRLAREAIRGIAERGRVPIVAGGTGLYLRALLDGLFPAPPRDEALRERLRRLAKSGSGARSHRLLRRLDPAAAGRIHPNDTPKLLRALEVTLAQRQPMTMQWEKGRDALSGFRILRIGLNPARAALYEQINQRAWQMFERGLIEETKILVEQYGNECRALGALGYAQAVSVLRGEITRDEAVSDARQGHRNYAKRQLTWFKRDAGFIWLEGFGWDKQIGLQAEKLVEQHLMI